MAELAEAPRNRLLRRVDWRFLLPDPSPRSAVCLAPDGLRQAVELITDAVLDPAVTKESCDLAVLANPDADMLLAAGRVVRDGGSCYAEWPSTLGRDAQSARRSLEAAGFEDVRCYWAWPSRDRCEAWLPLGDDAAFEYFFGVHRASRTALRRMWYAAQHRFVRLRYRSERGVPISAVARKMSNALAAPSEPAVLLETRAAGERLSWLLLTGGRRSENKVVALSFGSDDRAPRAVVKIGRVPESTLGLANEAAVLQTLELSRAGGIPGIPRLLSSRQFGLLAALAETPCIGRPLWSVLRRDNYRELALVATDWLVDLAHGSRTQPSPSASAEPIDAALADFERNFGAVLEPGMLRETQAVLGSLRLLPRVAEQRDCSPWNVFLSHDGRPLVLDWESSVLDGIPGVDLIYFLAYLSFYAHRAMRSGRYREVYRSSLSAETLSGRVHRECLAHYAARTGVDAGLIDALRLFTWVIHSRSEYRHRWADAGRAPTPAELRRTLFLSLWEEQLGWMRRQRTAGAARHP